MNITKWPGNRQRPCEYCVLAQEIRLEVIKHGIGKRELKVVSGNLRCFGALETHCDQISVSYQVTETAC